MSNDKGKGCVFCLRSARKKAKHDYLIYSGKRNYVVLNKYPYINGHIMVIPYRHVRDLDALTTEEMLEMNRLVQRGIQVLRRQLKAQGFNIGMNLGRAGGAGIAQHIHMHLIPRWISDTNFLPLLAETRCISQHLKETFKTLKKGWMEL